MTTTQDMVKFISEKLGWDKGSYWLIGAARACCPYDATEGFSLIVFVACAKAEMAKRGWNTWTKFGIISGHALWMSSHSEHSRSMVEKIDATDPIDEAMATLRCCADVLKHKPMS